MTNTYRSELLDPNLRAFLGDIDDGAMDPLQQHRERVCVAVGATPMAQGVPGHAMQLSVSGRWGDGDGAEYAVREMGQRQICSRLQSSRSRSELAGPVTVARVADLMTLTIFDGTSHRREKFDDIVKQVRAQGVEVLLATSAEAPEPVPPRSMRYNPV